MTSLTARTAAALAADGPLAGRLPGYVPRAAQQQLAVAISEAMDTRGTLVAEAGTGTGKTYAYLVPALLSGQRVIVSTGTRALQDQLYHRDLPRVREALGVGLKTALLKGRANYLCLYRMEQAKGEARFASREQASQFQRVVAWSRGTRRGDLAELADLPEDSPLWPAITSNTENCLGSECPFWDECFVVRARQQAQAADLVVVNHHLLLADLALKQEGFGEILPGAQSFVLDEAHQLPELASQFFGEAVSARMLNDLARDALAECRSVTGALATVQAPVRALEQQLRELRLAMQTLPPRGPQGRLLAEPGLEDGLDALADAMHALHDALATLAEASPGFAACRERIADIGARLARWRLVETGEETAGEEQEAPPRRDFDVRWYELTQRGFTLQRTPLDVAGPLRAFRERSGAAWIFTSATLAVGGQFHHIARKLGLGEHATLLEPSPFDWPTQALCYLPRGLPEPNSRDYTAAMLDAVWPVLEASHGRAFLLFTSHRALREAAERLADGPWPLFVQGSAPRNVLLERFRASGNGVLLGAASFWEGVDVAGEALSVVVIDRLPFAAPDDPVLEARLEAVRRGGGNAFRDEQLPSAVIGLKQGAGRLIRTHADRGVLVLCDPRLLGKRYGRVFLDSLPPLPRTRSLDDVKAFFARAADRVLSESA
ncbi:helicase C-terminal domain-containing protein [Rehaibacterium terrae]|uniref:ATP-dependent DNA helicase DinG n=1 Tax=Rehaibacterium terrae TaxID=1341696 RepID=A0A7W7Y0U6_9GAMM|nr:ATP-dependent DNA helicase DinG [Rehaibacterium terrae]